LSIKTGWLPLENNKIQAQMRSHYMEANFTQGACAMTPAGASVHKASDAVESSSQLWIVASQLVGESAKGVVKL
jgi:hypothetical protein